MNTPAILFLVVLAATLALCIVVNRHRRTIADLSLLRDALKADLDAARTESDRSAVEAKSAISTLRQQLQEARDQLHARTRYNGRRIEHEGKRGHIVRATVLGWYMDGPRPHLLIRPDPAPRRPAIPYGVPLAQCRFVDQAPTPPLPH